MSFIGYLPKHTIEPTLTRELVLTGPSRVVMFEQSAFLELFPGAELSLPESPTLNLMLYVLEPALNYALGLYNALIQHFHLVIR